MSSGACDRGKRRLNSSTSSWVVAAWKERGLLSPTATVTPTELVELHKDSWFVRRNRHAKHVRDVPEEGGSWVVRRNRHCVRHSAPVARMQSMPSLQLPEESSGSARRASLLGSLQARLPRREASDASSSCPVSVDEPHAAADVYLTLYDLCSHGNTLMHAIGLGVYHSGLEVGGLEYTYDNHAGSAGETGLVWHPPYHAAPSAAGASALPLRERLHLGRCPHGVAAAHAILRERVWDWPATAYDIVENNCHHFSAAAALALGVSPIPAWVDRVARVMLFFSGVHSEAPPARRAGQQQLSLAERMEVGAWREEGAEEEEEGAPLLGPEPARAAPPSRPHASPLPRPRSEPPPPEMSLLSGMVRRRSGEFAPAPKTELSRSPAPLHRPPAPSEPRRGGIGPPPVRTGACA